MPTRTTQRRLSLAGVALLSTTLALAACGSSAAPSTPTLQPPPPAPAASVTTPVATGVGAQGLGGPAVAVAPTVGAGSGAASTGVAGAASIAYPYPVYAGTPPVAPDHTIVVTGSGQASVKADGSDRSAAERTALAAAMDDAKGQADALARLAGLTITGVVSVSASIGQGYALPMGAAQGAPTGQAPASPGGAIAPVPVPVPNVPTTYQLGVAVTVAFRTQ